MTMVTDDSPNMSFSLYKCLHKMFFHRGSGTSTVSGPYIIFIRYTGKVWRCILLYSILFILYTSLHHSATCKPGLYYICRAFFLCEVLISLPVCFCELNRWALLLYLVVFVVSYDVIVKMQRSDDTSFHTRDICNANKVSVSLSLSMLST